MPDNERSEWQRRHEQSIEVENERLKWECETEGPRFDTVYYWRLVLMLGAILVAGLGGVWRLHGWVSAACIVGLAVDAVALLSLVIAPWQRGR